MAGEDPRKKKNRVDSIFLEIFKQSGMPKFTKGILRLFGKKDFVDQLDLWDNAPEGLVGVCLENYKKDLSEEKEILKKHNQKIFFNKGEQD